MWTSSVETARCGSACVWPLSSAVLGPLGSSTCSQVTHAKCASDIVDVYLYLYYIYILYIYIYILYIYIWQAISMSTTSRIYIHIWQMQYINVCLSFFGAWKVDSSKLISLPPHGLEGLWIMLAFTSSLEALLSIHACPGHRNLFPHWSGWWLDDSAGKGGPLLRLYKSIGAQQVGFGNWYNAVFSHWDVDGPKLKTRDTTVVLVMLLFLFSQYIAVHPSHPHLRPVAAPSCCGPGALASCSSFGKKNSGDGTDQASIFWRSFEGVLSISDETGMV